MPRSAGRFRRERNGASGPKGRASRMGRATGVYMEIHEDSEHRRHARSRAQRIYSQALSLLARREYSRKELAARLTRRGSPEDLAQQVLRDFAAAGWQSDERFAAALVASKTERGYGPLRIIAELKERGIDAEIITGSIRTGDPCWDERMLQTRAKHFGARLPVDRKERARQARYLVSRGFIPERVRRALAIDD